MPAQPTDRPSHTASIAAFALSLVLCGGLAVGGWLAARKVEQLPRVILPLPKAIPPLTPPRSSPPAAIVEEAGPSWNSLSGEQRHALEPLQKHWGTLTEAQKRKWISLARNFQKLSAANQAKIQDRMAAWAALTPEQRNRARLNFAATRKITPPAKQEQWDAYQALSEEARRALAARAAHQAQGAAIAVSPAAPHKFVKVPAADSGGASIAPNAPKVLPPVVDMVPVPVPVPATAPPATAPVPAAETPPVHAEPVPMPSATVTSLPPLPEESASPPVQSESPAPAPAAPPTPPNSPDIAQ
ncbi:MAG: DUF3106 domain-containing protein [Comamonas sp.]|nr:DUF3106 domain-containing protein [Comamonas sp.]